MPLSLEVKKDEVLEKVEKKVTREDVISFFPEFNFKKGADSGGRENYIGKSSDGLGLIQIIGPSELPSEISITVFMGPDSVDKMDLVASYYNRMMEKVTPNLSQIELRDDGDTKKIDGMIVIYNYQGFPDGVFSETYTFKLIK